MVLADTWYAHELGLEALASGPLTRRFGLLRGASFLLRGRRYELLVTTSSATGAHTLAALLAFFGQRKLVVLEFVQGHKPGLRAWLGRAFWRVTLPRAAYKVHVLTEWEVDAYGRYYAMPRHRFSYLPWPLERPADWPELPPQERAGVLASGFRDSDWETLIAAARGQHWDLTIVCGRREVGRVKRLIADERVTVLPSMSFIQHYALLGASSAYVLSLPENNGSAGQIRLMTAVAAGAPVVATAIRGLEGYLVGTAIAVPPADPVALRDAVNLLLRDKVWAKAMACSAQKVASSYPRKSYFRAMRKRLLDASSGDGE